MQPAFALERRLTAIVIFIQNVASAGKNAAAYVHLRNQLLVAAEGNFTWAVFTVQSKERLETWHHVGANNMNFGWSVAFTLVW